jgi:hypothetical protein
MNQLAYRLVTVVYATNELLEEVSGLILREPACLDNPVKELSTCCILHHNAKVLWSKEHLQTSIAARLQGVAVRKDGHVFACQIP